MNPAKERKSSQLRVRLTAAERAALERTAVERGKEETVSDVIRQILAAFLKLDGNQAPLFLSGHAHNQVVKLAKTLDKEERRVVEECVQGIWDLIEKPDLKVPLIVIEYQVRQDYQGRQDSGSKGK